MKGHPHNAMMVELDQNDRFLDFFRYLRAQVERDRQDRYTWEKKNASFHARRYCLDKRKTNWPFPGASDVWPPLSDMIIEQMKSLYLNLILVSSPPVTAIPMGDEGRERTQDIETWFEYEINYHSPSFMREQHYYVDDILSCGWGMLKTFWRYETRTTPDVLTAEKLPDELAARIVRGAPEGSEMLFLSEKQFDKMAWETSDIGGRQYPPTVLWLEHYYDLDREDKTDRRAIDQILAWMRAGAKKPLIFKRRDTVIDAAATAAIMPENVIMPAGASDVEDCFHVSHEMWLNGFQVRQKGRDSKWGYVDELLQGGKGHDDPRMARQGIAAVEAQRQGLSWSGGDKFQVIESSTWYDYDNDGVDEKIVVLWSPSTERPLKVYAYDRPSGLWPYHLCEFERNKRGIYASRGIPERLQDIEREMVVQKRAELNRLMISSALTLLVRQGSPAANQTIRWIPGEKITVADIHNDIAPLAMPDLSVIFQQQERLWNVWAERYIGTPNYAISNPLSNLNEPRTAKEISAIQSQSSAIGQTRISIYREQMARVFHEMFDLFHVFGPQDVWVNATSSEPLRLTKEDLQGAYSFVLGPLVGMDDPQLEAQKALMRIQVLTQIVQSGTLPKNVQVDMAEALKEWMRKDDPRAARKIIRQVSEEEMAQMEQDDEKQSTMQGMLLGMQGADAAQKQMAATG